MFAFGHYVTFRVCPPAARPPAGVGVPLPCGAVAIHHTQTLPTVIISRRLSFKAYHDAFSSSIFSPIN